MSAVRYSDREAGPRVETRKAATLLAYNSLQGACIRFGGPWGSYRGVIVEPKVVHADGAIVFSGELTTGGSVHRSVPPHCPVHIHTYR